MKQWLGIPSPQSLSRWTRMECSIQAWGTSSSPAALRERSRVRRAASCTSPAACSAWTAGPSPGCTDAWCLPSDPGHAKSTTISRAIQGMTLIFSFPLLLEYSCTQHAEKSLTLGGSVVILMPACRMEMGKSGCGELLSHRRKSGCGSSTCSCSTSLSSCGIQLRDKWQLARNTQLPCYTTPKQQEWVFKVIMKFSSHINAGTKYYAELSFFLSLYFLWFRKDNPFYKIFQWYDYNSHFWTL